MTADIARLSIAVDSTSVKSGEKALDGLTKAGEGAETQTNKLGAAFRGLVAVAGIGAIAKQFYETNAEFQRLNASLITVTKSQKSANEAFGDLQSFAATTPFQLREAVQAFITLKARGLDPSTGALTSYGNAASALGVSLGDMVQTVNSAIAGESEPVRRLGFDFALMGDKARISFDGITKVVDRNSREIQKAFLDISNAKFSGGMDRQMTTLGGAMSNLKDQIDATFYTMGNAGASSEMMAAIRGLTDQINTATPAMARFLDSSVTGTADLVRNIYEHRDAIVLLGGIYASVKIGATIDGMATSTQAWLAVKRQTIGASLIAKQFAIAEADSQRLVAIAAAQHATVQARLAIMEANTAPALKQVAAQKAKMLAIRESTAAIDAQIVAEARLATATGAVGVGSKVLGMLGGPIGIITTLLGVGITAWSLWGDAAKDAGQDAKDAMDKASGSTKDAVKALREQVEQLKGRERMLEGKGQSGAVVGGKQFEQADESTLKRVRQSLDAINSAEMGLEGIESGQRRFKSLNDKIQAEQALLGVIDRSKKTLEELSRLEADRLKTQTRVKGLEYNPNAAKGKDTSSKAASGVMEDLTKQNILLTQGERAAYAFDLAHKGLTATAQANALAMWDVNKSLEANQDLEKQLKNWMEEGTAAIAKRNEEEQKRIETAKKQITNEGAQLTAQMMTTGEKRNAELIRTEALLKGGAIGWETYTRKMAELEMQGSTLLQSLSYGLEGMGNDAADAFGRWVAGMDGAALSFRKMTQQMIADMARMAAQKGFSELLNYGMNSLAGSMSSNYLNTNPSGGSLFGSGNGGTEVIGSAPGIAQGGSSGQGLELFAVQSPSSSQGGATTINSSVTVNVSQDGKVDAKASGNMGAHAGAAIESVVIQTIQKLQRPGGMLNPTGARS